MSIRGWATSTDANMQLVMNALRASGALVWRISEPALPDLLVGWRQRWLLIEVKRPKSPGRPEGVLTPKQVKFHAACIASLLPVHIVRSPEEAVEVLNEVKLGANNGKNV